MEILNNCAICHVSMKRKPVIRLKACNHLLHEVCSRPILLTRSCPICRGEITGSEEVTRKRYNKYTPQDRARLVEAANRDDDWSSLATSLGVNYKTAFSWVNSGRSEGFARGGCRPKVLTENEINQIIQWVEENSTITLDGIKSKVFQNFRKSVCLTTISNYLDGRVYTTKSVHHETVTMNSAKNKEKRCVYVRALNECVRAGKEIAFIDETNFNLFCRRTRGRARAGTRAIQILPASRVRNVHLIITTSGVILINRRRGSFKAEDANEWVCSLLQRCLDMGNRLAELVIVCDNAPCHSRLESAVHGFQHHEKTTVLKLRPYSPMLNPIENIWSKIKSRVKANVGIPPTAGPGVMEQRLLHLEMVIDEAKATVRGEDCGRAIQHSTTFHADALALCDMPVGQ